MHPKIMVVEDELALSQLLQYNLNAEGYDVEVFSRGDDAETRLKEEVPDLMLLDWMLPGLSGIELCRRARMREKTLNLPIIMLTARSEESERIRGLSVGADDFVIKPFSVPELMARVKALLRRTNPNKLASLLIASDIELDRNTHKITRKEREIKLGPTEFKLLEFFMTSPGRVYSREQLLNGVWGRDKFVDERTVDVHVGRLRRAINRGKETDPIATIRGAGYAFNDSVKN